MAKKDIVPEVDDSGEVVVPQTIVQKQAELMANQNQFIRFRRKAMVQIDEPYPHFEPLNMEKFKELFYPHIPGQTRSRVGDVYEQLTFAAPDYTEYDHLILFGLDVATSTMHPEYTDYDAFFSTNNRQLVWDSKEVSWVYGEDVNRPIWRSPYARVKAPKEGGRQKLKFIMDLAQNDPMVYDDIMQSIAPIIMDRKPDGVVWWIGDGANGKSTLMDAIYRMFPGQLSSITVKRLVDGRDTPNLNGTLANIVKESSEGRIDDTEIYKSIGTHEDFGAHKFHSQEGVTIRGNLHHIFSGNSIPIFNDKGFSARRRTFIIPFNATFASNPNFEDETFTAAFFGQFIDELAYYAQLIKSRGYKYKWSDKTMAAKKSYDTEANNAEEYTSELLADGVVAFDNFGDVRADYENWCRENGYVELGKGYMRRAVLAVGFERMTVRTDEGGTTKRYRLPTVESKDLQPLGGFRQGLYTVSGFEREAEPEPVTVPDFPDAPPEDEVEKKGSEW